MVVVLVHVPHRRRQSQPREPEVLNFLHTQAGDSIRVFLPTVSVGNRRRLQPRGPMCCLPPRNPLGRNRRIAMVVVTLTSPNLPRKRERERSCPILSSELSAGGDGHHGTTDVLPENRALVLVSVLSEHR